MPVGNYCSFCKFPQVKSRFSMPSASSCSLHDFPASSILEGSHLADVSQAWDGSDLTTIEIVCVDSMTRDAYTFKLMDGFDLPKEDRKWQVHSLAIPENVTYRHLVSGITVSNH